MFQREPDRYPQIINFYNWLEETAVVEKEVLCDEETYHCNSFKVYRLKKQEQSLESVVDGYIDRLKRTDCKQHGEMKKIEMFLRTSPAVIDSLPEAAVVLRAADYIKNNAD